MKIIGLSATSRACVYGDLLHSEDGEIFVFRDAIITKLGLLFLVEYNNKLIFLSLEEVVEEIICKEWKE
ncbi:MULTISPECIES: hypothetical protein [unclassified Pseudodesulfovibrio]|uniref:hypothetical protein n=1 Tax=unclassified Pseudodesulfovibrio TaxID=2661612 RepID=UPI000FEBA2A1|nr:MULTISPECIES: hypothetical protein [unclassified Pseudodesulfovibrio]MCJ2164691.1 hypothetical protein [Pseudodesulfovibrio sp. S3-i]RWU04117.1 hypothetical protein DWB63_08915 [Pseudodesulfovibrio sp. S3]